MSQKQMSFPMLLLRFVPVGAFAFRTHTHFGFARYPFMAASLACQSGRVYFQVDHLPLPVYVFSNTGIFCPASDLVDVIAVLAPLVKGIFLKGRPPLVILSWNESSASATTKPFSIAFTLILVVSPCSQVAHNRYSAALSTNQVFHVWRHRNSLGALVPAYASIILGNIFKAFACHPACF